jgi:parvulin-like peptidyl-prolyl isomerase
LNTLGKGLLILGIILAIGGGLFVWKTQVSKADGWTKVSKEEMELILKDLNPQMVKQIAAQPDGKKKITEELKQLLAFAAEARKTGVAAEPGAAIQLEIMRAQITASFYDKETHKDKGPMPPFGFIKPEDVEAFWTKPESQSGFDKFFASVIDDAKKSKKLPEGQEPSEEEIKQLKDVYAKITIYDAEAKAKMASGELNEDFKKRLDLQIKIQQSSYLAQKYAQDSLQKAVEPTDEEIAAYIKEHPEMDMSGKKTKADELLVKAVAGEDFAKLADENTEDPGNKNQKGENQGGIYKDVTKGKMMKEFEEAALALEPGKVANKLVETPYGYHIIKLEKKGSKKSADGKDEETYDVRHILISNMYQDKENPSSRPQPVKDYLKGKLGGDKQKKLIEEIVARNQIVVAEDFVLPEIKEEDLPKAGMPPGMSPGANGPDGGQQIDPKQLEELKKQIEAQQKSAPKKDGK